MQDKLVQVLKNLDTKRTARVYKKQETGQYEIKLIEPGNEETIEARSPEQAALKCWDWCFPQ